MERTNQTDFVNSIAERIDELLACRDRVLVAIDGSCAAGKTTLAAALADYYHCNVLHMDDFFLRPEQRTPQRFAEAGGNVDYERFFAEVLLPLKTGAPFTYRPFDCKTFALSPGTHVIPGKLTIIEGSYSLHPCFEDPYDLKIFLSVDEELQHRRILARPEHLHRRFFEEWIPMEHRYFREFGIREKCDIIR